jgi:hypothetical protein
MLPGGRLETAATPAKCPYGHWETASLRRLAVCFAATSVPLKPCSVAPD